MAPEGGRAGIIQAVQTALGFFVLVLLVAEAILGLVVLNLEAGTDRTFIIRGMIVLIFALVIIVTLLALSRRLTDQDPLQTASKYSLYIGPPDRPEKFKNLDVRVIDWDDQCFLVAPGVREKISLVRSRYGPSVRVEIPPKVVERVKGEAVELELQDRKGNSWRVDKFFLFETLQPLSVVESEAKIIQDYVDEEQ